MLLFCSSVSPVELWSSTHSATLF